MSADSWIALIVLIATIAVLVTDRLPPVVVLGCAVGALLFTDVIQPDVALSGLSSPAPATIAALYVLAGAATATGTFAGLVDRTLNRRGALPALAGSTAALSAVVPNTPLIAMFAPRVVRWSQRTGNDASRYLLPLSFASILGGVVTLIGTSTNLVVSDLLEQSGDEPLGVFEITVVGLPVAVVGVVVLSTIGVRLLPERTGIADDLGQRAREFQMAARVTTGGPLVGRTIGESGLRNLDGIFLAMIERGGSDGGEIASVSAAPDTMLEAGDVCCFVGDAARVIDLHELAGLEATEQSHVLGAEGAGTQVFEAVVSPTSRLVGQSLRSVDFRSRYRGAVMAIHRSDATLGGQLGRIPLRAGDVLLVLAEESFSKRWRGDADFSLVAAISEPPPARRSRSWLVVTATIAMVAIAATGWLSLFESALIAAAAVILGGAITLREGWRAVNLNVVLTMAAAISLGAGVAQSGLAGEIAGLVERSDDLGFGNVGLVVAVMLATLVMTELLTNTAAAAVMLPIALSVAADAEAEPRMLAIAVLIGASCSFLSPVGYQTNLMVYGLGGYKFSDFTRVGAPLTVATVITSAIIIPVAFG
ncbi:SLC13 family permease [Ilumatobacter nonamiensis]|uniref:SLC13 family permease n=1 Tax=Ilumatobacter nonamiensis TaxID=467093 RepID=UPI00034B820C|nr:SLC13 family permease [Ilumatobacter nonamiensis]